MPRAPMQMSRMRCPTSLQWMGRFPSTQTTLHVMSANIAFGASNGRPRRRECVIVRKCCCWIRQRNNKADGNHRWRRENVKRIRRPDWWLMSHGMGPCVSAEIGFYLMMGWTRWWCQSDVLCFNISFSDHPKWLVIFGRKFCDGNSGCYPRSVGWRLPSAMALGVDQPNGCKIRKLGNLWHAIIERMMWFHLFISNIRIRQRKQTFLDKANGKNVRSMQKKIGPTEDYIFIIEQNVNF